MLPLKALGAGPSCVSQHQVAGGCQALQAYRRVPPVRAPSSRLLPVRMSVSKSLSIRPTPIHWDLIYKAPFLDKVTVTFSGQ